MTLFAGVLAAQTSKKAVVALVSSCAKSTFCLALLQDSAPMWPIAMAKARDTTYKEHARAKDLPHVV